MKKVLLVSHGEMATGTKKAAEMIAGKLVNLDALCLSEDIDVTQFRKRLDSKLDEYTVDDQVIIIADLMGGSPYVTSLTVLDERKMLDKCFVIAGLNLSLVLSIMFANEKLTKAEINDLINDSKKYIQLFENIEQEEEDF